MSTTLPQPPRRELTHGQMLARLIVERRPFLPPDPVFVETGCGLSTVYLAEAARACNATAWSCDFNEAKVAALKRHVGEHIKHVNFLIGDSHEGLRQILARHPRLDIVFLDAAASAMHTIHEFLIIEPHMPAGSALLIDNAALPGERALLSPCRKGRIVVPYLLASPWWEVRGHPTAGDSMISAIRHDQPVHAHPDYEWPEFVDTWQDDFARAFGTTGTTPQP